MLLISIQFINIVRDTVQSYVCNSNLKQLQRLICSAWSIDILTCSAYFLVYTRENINKHNSINDPNSLTLTLGSITPKMSVRTWRRARGSNWSKLIKLKPLLKGSLFNSWIINFTCSLMMINDLPIARHWKRTKTASACFMHNNNAGTLEVHKSKLWIKRKQKS